MLKGVDLTVYENEIAIILGKNGEGKSTLINILIGRLNKNYGDISLIDNMNKKIYTKLDNLVGVCPQQDIIFPHLTVRDQLYLFSIFKNSTVEFEQELSSISHSLKLDQLLDKHAATLSGGQKRRATIAIA